MIVSRNIKDVGVDENCQWQGRKKEEEKKNGKKRDFAV
jgi:hypothetical protein